ncbi:MAG: tRNA guanosine(34) transglycosylase Tgt [Acidobacteriota bacterium]
MPFAFSVTHADPCSGARCGLLRTGRGEIETPVFMPVGTAGTVKALPHELLEQLNASIILCNTYHLYLRPGEQIINQFGGLHRFISWSRPILTDSGGFQVFSHQALRKISEEGVEFQSHLDGSYHFLSPERSIEIQRTLGSDIIMSFDECTPYPVTEREARESMLRSMRWAQRCRQALGGVAQTESQALFGIVQGSMFLDLRKESLELLSELDLPGLALGGFSVGEPKLLMYEVVARLGDTMPPGKLRYLMGVGTPLDIIFSVRQGIDMFDCVLPTRNARNGMLFTSAGKVRIKNTRYSNDESPPDPDCACLVCRRYSRAYLRHLFISGEILSSVLNTYHNVYFYLQLMRQIRGSIRDNRLADLERKFQEQYTEGD